MSTETPSLFKRLLSAGVSRGYASDLATGKRLPSLKMAVQLQDKLGIQPEYWARPTSVRESDSPESKAEKKSIHRKHRAGEKLFAGSPDGGLS